MTAETLYQVFARFNLMNRDRMTTELLDMDNTERADLLRALEHRIQEPSNSDYRALAHNMYALLSEIVIQHKLLAPRFDPFAPVIDPVPPFRTPVEDRRRRITLALR